MMIDLLPDERIDDLQCKGHQIIQNPNMFCFGMDAVLLPRFSCHILRHTFTTRMCEAGVNVKVMQEVLGHKDISTTMNIYADVTKELETTEFENLDRHFTAWMKDADENGNVERVS